MEKTKLQRGGARIGAGRKLAGEEKRVTLAIRIEPATLRKLEALAAGAGVSKGQFVEQLVNEKMPAANVLYAIRESRVEPVFHLRGKLYCPISEAKTFTKINGVAHARVEWIIAEKNIFGSHAAAEQELCVRSKIKTAKTIKERKEFEQAMAVRDKLIAEVVYECNSRGSEPPRALGFCTPDDLKNILRDIRELDNNR